VQIDIAAIPLPDLRLSHWRDPVFAPDERGGSQTTPDTPDCVLIIEDDLLIASQIEATLTEAGFEIVGVTGSGEEALELAKTRAPALAIIDIRLSGDQDGVDTAIELFRLHGIRCIFASAYSDREARRRAEPAAPLGWLQKPYSMASLSAIVRAAASELRGKGS
jgi:two-component system, response regulator PdtaR